MPKENRLNNNDLIKKNYKTMVVWVRIPSVVFGSSGFMYKLFDGSGVPEFGEEFDSLHSKVLLAIRCPVILEMAVCASLGSTKRTNLHIHKK